MALGFSAAHLVYYFPPASPVVEQPNERIKASQGMTMWDNVGQCGRGGRK